MNNIIEKHKQRSVLMIKRLIVGQMQTNCYLVYDSIEKKVVIIDPGDNADYIINTISSLGLTPVGIVATHGHFDHVLASLELQLAYDIPFMINAADEFLLAKNQSSALYFTGIPADPPPFKSTHLSAKDKVKIGPFLFRVIHTPGHTPGSLTFYCRKAKVAFVGDSIFAEGFVGRTDFKYSDIKKLEISIQKILNLPAETLLYSGHGNEILLSKAASLIK